MNLMELFIKLTVDDKGVGEKLDDNAEKAATLGSKMGTGLKVAAGVGVAAIGAAATAISSLVKQSISAYADYEQLVGGVETLFKDSADIVQKYAANAYKTAGLSANEYMETSISFSAALIQSLEGNTEKAAELTNRAITDMSDNANKMGTDMEAIQNAYKGFSKQNFTMLDNLALGYGGTKQEMERLIDDANKLRAAQGLNADLTIDSYADIIEAIHTVQVEMDIAGTTQKEAAETISGSLGMLKGSWTNLITGISDDNADFDSLTQNLVDSITTVGKNILPRIATALSGVGKLVEGLAPVIISAIGTIVTDVLPSLLKSAAGLVSKLSSALVANLPMLLDAAMSIIMELANGLSNPTGLMAVIDTGLTILMSLVDGIANALPQIIAVVPRILSAFLSAIIVKLPQIIASGITIINSLVSGLIQAIPQLVAAVPALIIGIVHGIIDNLDQIIVGAVDIVLAIIEGLIGAIPQLIQAIPELINAIVRTFKNYDWGKIGKNIVNGLKDGIKNSWESFKKFFSDKIKGLVGSVKELLGIHSPSKVFAGIGKFMAEGLGEGWNDEYISVEKRITGGLDFTGVVGEVDLKKGDTERSEGNLVVNQYIQAVAQTPVEFASTTEAYFEQARWQMA